MFGGATVSWGSRKQTGSCMESELIALGTTWILSWMVEEPIYELPIHFDSRAAIELLKQDTVNRKLNGHLYYI